jgi:hypothetical protein
MSNSNITPIPGFEYLATISSPPPAPDSFGVPEGYVLLPKPSSTKGRRSLLSAEERVQHSRSSQKAYYDKNREIILAKQKAKRDILKPYRTDPSLRQKVKDLVAQQTSTS